MNRIYSLVWNRALGMLQAASEHSHSRGSSSGMSASRTLRRHPLALAIAALAFTCVSVPAWSQTCTPADSSGCGASGGIGGRPGRSPDGGAGNGTGGDAIVWNPNTSESAGNVATNGVGGKGADGVFDVGGTNITSSGGAGGSVGATGSTGVNASVTGGTGGAGQAESGGSIVGGGGGGGGAGVYINDANSAPIIGSTTTLAGGMGGRGGDATATVANGNATNGDPGAGGGGGAGVIIASGAGGVSLINNGRILGGAGGNGGNGGYAGGGGGGGDGLLVLGVGSAITNNTTGSIIGGLGGNPGVYQDGGNLPGGYGGGGAGVNLVGAGSSLENAGTIIGGNANTVSPISSAQDGQPGVGVRGWGGTTVVTDGSIAGGSNGNAQADSVLFSGGGNQIVLLSGASFTGDIESISGSTNGGDIFTLAGDANGSLNAGLIVGFASNIKTGNSNWTLTGTGNAGINWTIQQGELTGSSDTFNGSLTFVSDGIGTPAVDFDEATTGSYAGTIGGAGKLIKDGTGSLTLSGDLSTFSGPFTINQGTVAVTGNGSLQGANVSDAGTLDISGTSGSTATVARISGSGVVTVGSHTLAINNAAGDNFSGVIGGTGGVVLNAGTQTFSGSNLYLGGTTLDGGTLAVSSDANLGNSSGAVVLDGGTLETTSALTTARSFALTNNIGGTLQTDASLTIAGSITGNGALTKTGSGTLVLAGTDNYTGGTTISAGTLQGDTTSLQGDITDNAALVFDQTSDGTYSGVISGTGTLSKTGIGTLVLAGNNNFSGGTTISAGTLQGDTNSLQGDILDNAALVFDQTSNGTYSGVISGTGTLTASGTGTLTLDGANTANGLTTVASGSTLIVGDSSHATATAGGDVSVSGGTLSGFGTVQGNVTLSGGAAMTPGTALAAGTLTVGGDLNIGTGSNLNFDFGAPGPNFSTPGQSDHVVVNGNLAIASSTLNASNLGSMGPGLYNLFTWGGALTITGGGFAPPSGMSLQILTATKQINLVDTQGLTLDEWDADGLASATQMGGGSGTWSVSSNTWSDTNGQHVGPMSPQPGFAIFGGAAGTVTVDDSGGQVGVTGMQFASDGYHLTGGAIDLVGQGGVAPVMRVSSGATATIDNELDGTSGLNKTDGGTLVLTGSNPYTGTTTLSGGYLSVSSDANLGDAADPLDFEGGTLEITGTTFNQTARTMIWGSAGGGFDIDASANTFTVTQTLGGSGGLLKSGAGTLTLTGANTFTGGTAVAAGTLAVGNDQALGTGTVDMAAGTTLSFAANGLSLANAFALNGDPTFDVASGQTDTMSGVIADGTTAGALEKTGDGTLVLTGADTYTGGTIINAGALQIGNGGTAGSIVGNVSDNGTLAFDRSDAVTFSGAISGTGSLIQRGSGTLMLDGDSGGFTGSTAVSSGTLVVGDAAHATASLGGTVSIANGATIGGAGTVGGLDLSGAFSQQAALGNIGTLHVNGNATFEQGSTFDVQAAPGGQADLLAATGTVAINGGNTLVIAQTGNWASRTDYTIITANGGVSGQFASVSDNLAFLDPVLSYQPDAVQLSLQRNDVNFNTVAATPNEQGAATAANGLGWNSSLYQALVLLDAPTARAAFDQISGEYHASQQTARLDDSRYVREAMNQRLIQGGDDLEATHVEGTTVDAWAHAWGHWGTTDSDGNAGKLADNGDGLLIGADLPVGAQGRIGLTGGASRYSLSIGSRASWGRLTSQWLGAFGGFEANAFALRGGVAYAWDQVPGNREVSFPGYSDRLSSNAAGDTLTGFLEGGWTFKLAQGYIEPFVNLAHARVKTDQTTEAGGSAALHADGATANVSFGTAGARGTFELANHFDLHGELDWQHAFGDTTPERTLQFASGRSSFTEYGVPVAKNAGLGRLGIGWHRRNVAIDADYEGLFGGGARDQAAKLSLDVAL